MTEGLCLLQPNLNKRDGGSKNWARASRLRHKGGVPEGTHGADLLHAL